MKSRFTQVAYSHARAKVLHSLPLVLVLTRMLVRGGSSPSLSSVGNGAVTFAASCVCAVLAPALLGIARVLLLGKHLLQRQLAGHLQTTVGAMVSMMRALNAYTQAVQWFGIHGMQ